jgi:hypothetical protein
MFVTSRITGSACTFQFRCTVPFQNLAVLMKWATPCSILALLRKVMLQVSCQHQFWPWSSTLWSRRCLSWKRCLECAENLLGTFYVCCVSSINCVMNLVRNVWETLLFNPRRVFGRTGTVKLDEAFIIAKPAPVCPVLCAHNATRSISTQLSNKNVRYYFHGILK